MFYEYTIKKDDSKITLSTVEITKLRKGHGNQEKISIVK